MKRCALLLSAAALLAGGCASRKPAERHQVRALRVSADTLAAIMAEELSVTLHEVTVTPRRPVCTSDTDTALPCLTAARVEIGRRREARVEQSDRTAEATETRAELIPPRPSPSPWPWLAAILMLTLLLRLLLRRG